MQRTASFTEFLRKKSTKTISLIWNKPYLARRNSHGLEIQKLPHCGDGTFLVKDIDNIWVENCLQCGYEADKYKAVEKPQTIKPFTKAISPAVVPVQLDS